MTNLKIVFSKIAHSQRLKSFRTSAALILTTLILMVAATTTVATAQTYTDLFNFDYTDGAATLAVVAQGRDGNLYGTTFDGGTNHCGAYNCGVVFKITPSGTLKVLYNFDGTHGAYPWGGLTLGTDGNFYGKTSGGGANGYGTIFKITKSGNLTTLYSFTDGADGAGPYAPPIQGTDGNFYGTTTNGTAYKITSSGTFTPLGSLPGASYAPLLQATDGNFYGTTWNGGNSNNCNGGCGTVFKITPKGKVKIVCNFDSTHGGQPRYGGLVQGSDGNFYGTTFFGGDFSCADANGCGTVFKLTQQGAITVLHNFPDPNYLNDGYLPSAGLVQATDGNFYGVTPYPLGVIFQITLADAYSILYNFDGVHGGEPYFSPMQHTDGKIYGLASGGPPPFAGVVYSFDMGLGPFVRLVSTTGKVGRTIEVLGQGFTGTTAVSFNGTAATFKVVSDTYLKATVPTGATTGTVTVTTPGGSLNSDTQFRVTPKILSFTPTSGPVGTPVTITGNSLTQTTKVTFGGVLATSFTVNSDTQVAATVPTGAKTGYIAITTAGGKTWSPTIFTVTQ